MDSDSKEVKGDERASRGITMTQAIIRLRALLPLTSASLAETPDSSLRPTPQKQFQRPFSPRLPSKLLVRQWAETLRVICGSRRLLISVRLATGFGGSVSGTTTERVWDEKTKSVALSLGLRRLKARLGFQGFVGFHAAFDGPGFLLDI